MLAAAIRMAAARRRQPAIDRRPVEKFRIVGSFG